MLASLAVRPLSVRCSATRRSLWTGKGINQPVFAVYATTTRMDCCEVEFRRTVPGDDLDDVDVVAHLDELRPSPDEQPVVSSVYPLSPYRQSAGSKARQGDARSCSTNQAHNARQSRQRRLLWLMTRNRAYREEPWGDCCHEGAATEVVDMMAVGIELRTLDLVPWRVDCQVYWPRSIPLQLYQ